VVIPCTTGYNVLSSYLFYLIVEAVGGNFCTWSHPDKPDSVRLLWTRDQPVTETSTW